MPVAKQHKWGKKFFERTDDAHHELGISSQTTVSEALGLLGDYTIEMRPVMFEGVDGEAQVIPDRQAIVRTASADWPTEAFFNIASPRYVSIQPMQLANIYDQVSSTHYPIDMMGIRRDGAQMFWSVPLPTIDINGEEVKQYVYIINSFDGTGALTVTLRKRRMRCLNEFVGIQHSARYRIHHTGSVDRVLGEIREAFHRVFNELPAHAAEEQQFFNTMAEYKTEPSLAEQLFQFTWPVRPEPQRRDFRDGELFEVLHDRWETQSGSNLNNQSLARSLWSDVRRQVAEPTMWDLFNAGTEVINWANYRSGKTRMNSLLFGTREQELRRMAKGASRLMQGQVLVELKTDNEALRQAFNW